MNTGDKKFYDQYFKTISGDPLENMKQASRIKLLSQLAPANKSKVLFVGCGVGDELAIISRPVVALDLSRTALRKAIEKNENNKFVQGDISSLPFKDGSFNCIICSEVMEHLPDPSRAVRELYTAVEKGGILVLTVPNWVSLFGLARKIAELILRHKVTAANQPIDNWFTLNDLKAFLQSYFEILKVKGCWYYAPMGKGTWHLPPFFTFPLFRLMRPLENFASKRIPAWGHIMVLRASKGIRPRAS